MERIPTRPESLPVPARLDASGRLSIPARLRESLGLTPDTPLILEPVAEGLRVCTRDAAIREAKAYFARLAPAEVCMSEELSADRREEAARE